MINLADQSDVSEKEKRTDQVTGFGCLGICATHVTEVISGRVRSDHQQQPSRDLNAAGNIVPVSGNQQDDAAANERRANDRNDRQELARSFF